MNYDMFAASMNITTNYDVHAKTGKYYSRGSMELAGTESAAVTCYAVEGMYPDSVDYLREHYQLSYDESRYFVTYEAFASNRIPDIYVTERGAKLP